MCPRGSGLSLEMAGLVKLARGSGLGAEGFCVPLLLLPGEFWRERYRAGMLTSSGSCRGPACRSNGVDVFASPRCLILGRNNESFHSCVFPTAAKHPVINLTGLSAPPPPPPPKHPFITEQRE